jgi:hypothetical protein
MTLFIDLKANFSKKMLDECIFNVIINKLLIFWMILVRFKSSFGSEPGSGSITSTYGSGSCKKFRILADPDPQHCLQEQDFPGRNLLQRASSTPEELLSGANFPRRLLQQVRSPERSAPAYF